MHYLKIGLFSCCDKVTSPFSWGSRCQGPTARWASRTTTRKSCASTPGRRSGWPATRITGTPRWGANTWTTRRTRTPTCASPRARCPSMITTTLTWTRQTLASARTPKGVGAAWSRPSPPGASPGGGKRTGSAPGASTAGTCSTTRRTGGATVRTPPTPWELASAGWAVCGVQTACSITVCRTPRGTIQTRARAIPATRSFASGGWLLLPCLSWPLVCAVTCLCEPATTAEWCAGAAEGSTKRPCDSVSLPTLSRPQPQGDSSSTSSHLPPLPGTQGAFPAWGACLVDSAAPPPPTLHRPHPGTRAQCSKERTLCLDAPVLLTICNQANYLIQVLISCPSCPPCPVSRHLQQELLIFLVGFVVFFPKSSKGHLPLGSSLPVANELASSSSCGNGLSEWWNPTIFEPVFLNLQSVTMYRRWSS